jgi:ubiquinone/menaquinone biosynthesis C-methylase UbiE
MNQRGEFFGVDISPIMIEKAKENSRGDQNTFFYNSSAEQLPFQDALIDLVMCTNSFIITYIPPKH